MLGKGWAVHQGRGVEAAYERDSIDDWISVKDIRHRSKI